MKKLLRISSVIAMLTSFLYAVAIPSADASARLTSMVILLKSPQSAPTGATAQAVNKVRNAIRAEGGVVTNTTMAPVTITANLSPTAAIALRTNPNVALVAPNAVIYGPTPTIEAGKRTHVTKKSTSTHAVSSRATISKSDTSINGVQSSSSICGTSSSPEIDPEAVTTVNAPAAWQQHATGAGVSVGFMADGVDTTNPDLQRNTTYNSTATAGSPVITAQPDFSGDGNTATTAGGEAFLDASSIAAQGNTVYDLYNYPDWINSPGCDVTITGTAPGATLTSLKVFGQTNLSTTSGFVEAIQYAITNHLQVLNESFGSNPMGDSTVDAIKIANDAAVAAGITVVVSTGDAGPTSTIGSPASDPKVIAVGATTTYRAYAQGYFGGFNAMNAANTAPLGNGTWINNNISAMSSGGTTQSGRTVDLVAPGELNWALCSTSATYTECGGSNLMVSGGTSEAAPLTAGAAADVIQAYKSAHRGRAPSPAVVKEILMSTATDVNAPATEQGAGLLNIGAAVQMAKTVNMPSGSGSGAILSRTPALTLSGGAGKTASANVRLTNTSSSSVTVSLAGRALTQTGNQAGQVVLDPSLTSLEPTFQYWSGASEVYQEAQFQVPTGTDRVDLSSDFADTGQTSVLHVALFDPSGAYAGYSESQGLADRTNIEVAEPAAGTWTAFFFTVSATYHSGVGTKGPVQWESDFYQWTPVSLGASSVPIGANASVTIPLSVTLPNVAGDYSSSIQVTQGSQVLSIPVTERAAIPIAGGAGNFRGELNGGNGRAGVYGQASTFDFTVPRNTPNIEADIELANYQPYGNLPGDQIIGALFNPHGTLMAYDTNVTVDQQNNLAYLPYLSLYTTNPTAGKWQIELWVANPVAGNTLVTPFHGQILLDALSVTSNLPDSPATSVSATSGTSATVAVTNNGLTPLLISTDARGSSNSTYSLGDISSAPATQALNHYWQYLVPTQTSAITASLSSSQDATFDVSQEFGDPGFSALQTAPNLTTSSNTLTYSPPGGVEAGIWVQEWAYANPVLGTPADATQTATASFSVTTKTFDDAVTTSIGDVQEYFLGFGANAGYGQIIYPGQTLYVGVDIQPTASPGTAVSGTLSIQSSSVAGVEVPSHDELTGTNPYFSDLAVLPYAYTVSS